MLVEQYAAFTDLFQRHLNAYCEALAPKLPTELYEPESYILSLGGKRVRPLLALLACDLFDAPSENALNAALSVELFHNFSLIHDDILDQAPLRRGKDTVHVKWNQNIGILSGDAMLVKSIQILESYDEGLYKRLSSTFMATAIEVCEGQQLDMNFETRNDVSVADYLEMIAKKTAVLLGCSLQMGAQVAGANLHQQEHLYRFGKHLGIAFQLLDDYLDAFAEQSSGFGKQIGGDILANKKTFLTLKSIELADNNQKQIIGDLFAQAANPTKITEMLNLYQSLGVDQLCKQAANEHTSIAIEALGNLDANEQKKNNLMQFALGLLGRQK